MDIKTIRCDLATIACNAVRALYETIRVTDRNDWKFAIGKIQFMIDELSNDIIDDYFLGGGDTNGQMHDSPQNGGTSYESPDR